MASLDMVDQLVILEEQFKRLLPLLHQKANYTDVLPVGALVHFASNNNGIPIIPKGFLYADGAELNRTVYAQLFNAIGTIGGAGDGVTTFNIPDLRNMFIRGYDNRTDRPLGSVQQDAMRKITGSFGALDSTEINGVFTYDNNSYHTYQRTTSSGKSGIKFDNSLVTNVAEENRPVNQVWIPCIKYTNFVGPDSTFYADSDNLYVKGSIYVLGQAKFQTEFPPGVEPSNGMIFSSSISIDQQKGIVFSYQKDQITGDILAYQEGKEKRISFADTAITISSDFKEMIFRLNESPKCDVFTLVFQNLWIPLSPVSDTEYKLGNQDIIAKFMGLVQDDNLRVQFRTFYKDA